MDSPTLFLRIAAALGLSGVALGAFGAHGLRSRLEADLLDIFEVGVRYQMYHALALLALSLAPAALWSSRWTAVAGWSWLVGVLIFSGSLYILAISGVRWLGAITPIGGVALIVGWAMLFVAAGSLTAK